MFENSLIVVNIKLDNARWFLRGLNKPFDPFAQKAMHDTMIGIANCTEAVWAYHIGNEIVLYLNPNAISRCKTMLSGMTRDNFVSYIASLTTVIFNLNYGRLMEKLDKCSNIEKIRLDNYKSKQYLARFDCTVRECDRDITPIIKTIKNTQEILYCKVIDGGGGYKVYARWFGMVNTSYSSYNTLGKIEGAFQLSFPMSYDPIRIASISNTRCCVSSDDERKGNEKVPKNKDRTMGRFSVVEYGLYHMYIQTSTKAILRNGVTEDDLKLLIQTILHMFDDDMSSVRPSMTVRKVVVVRQNRNSGRVRPTDIEDAMVAKLKPGVNNPTSFNDYDLEFKRDMLPDSVEVKEYTMDNPEGVIL